MHIIQRAVALLVVLAGCKSAVDEPATVAASDRPTTPGVERANCRGDIGKRCDPGLVCLSNTCVKPPPADCHAVAEVFAAFDLGNYAEPDERQPVVDKYLKQCEAAYVTKEEGKCVLDAKDKYVAQECAPKMFPEDPQSDAKASCDKAVEVMRATIAEQMGQMSGGQDMVGKLVTVMLTSCKEDKWPRAMLDCIVKYAPKATNEQLTECSKLLPKDIELKMTERMTKVMQTP